MKKLKLYDRTNWTNSELRDAIDMLMETLEDRLCDRETISRNRDILDLPDRLCGLYFLSAQGTIKFQAAQTIIDSNCQLQEETILAFQSHLNYYAHGDWDRANEYTLETVSVALANESLYHIKCIKYEYDMSDDERVDIEIYKEHYLTRADLEWLLRGILSCRGVCQGKLTCI